MNVASDKIHKLVRYGVIVAYAVAVEWIAVRVGNPADPWWWLTEVAFFVWIVAPIAVPLLQPIRHWLLTGGVAAMAGCSLYVYERAMFGPDTNSTSALIFVFLPLYQWVVTAVLLVAAAIASRRKSR